MGRPEYAPTVKVGSVQIGDMASLWGSKQLLLLSNTYALYKAPDQIITNAERALESSSQMVLTMIGQRHIRRCEVQTKFHLLQLRRITPWNMINVRSTARKEECAKRSAIIYM